MSDLNKLLAKMQGDKPTEEAPVEEEVKKEEVVVVPEKVEEKAPVEELADDDDQDGEEKVDEETPKVETYDPEEKDVVEFDKQEQITLEEVAMLQNEGIFRRELLATFKHFVAVHEANTQTLIDIKKKLLGEENDSK